MKQTTTTRRSPDIRFIRAAALPAFVVGLSLSLPVHSADAPQSTTRADAGKSAATAHGQKSGAQKQYRAMRASELIGADVRNTKGEDIGEISDLIVNVSTGDVRYAVLEFDPGILSAEKLFAVPTTELRWGADRDQIVYDVRKERLENATIERKDWTERFFDDRKHITRLDKAWNVAQPADASHAYRVSDLLGKDVKSRTGEDIGNVEELVVNMANRKIHYAVLAFDPSWAEPEKNFAFPMKSFRLANGNDDLVLDVDKSKIQAMKSFDDNRYSNLNDNVWVADIDHYLVTVAPAGQGQQSGTAGSGTSARSFDTLDADQNGSLSRKEFEGSSASAQSDRSSR